MNASRGRRIRSGKASPQAGKTLLRLIVGGRGVGTPIPTPCRRPPQRFSCNWNGLLRRLFKANAACLIEIVNNAGYAADCSIAQYACMLR
jgi:hypothetical protein